MHRAEYLAKGVVARDAVAYAIRLAKDRRFAGAIEMVRDSVANFGPVTQKSVHNQYILLVLLITKSLQGCSVIFPLSASCL